MKVLVTGANGFLGSWLTRALVAEGHDVHALVRKNSDLSELQGVSCKYLFGDVTDFESLKTAMTGMEAVFHLAGVIAYKKADRPLMDKVNVQGTANVVEACKVQKIPRLVYLSSVVAIGAGFNSSQILNEDSIYNISRLDLGYFQTKHFAEKIVKEACDKNEINAVILNPSTIYGPGDAKKGSRKTQLKVAQGKFPFFTGGGVNVVAVEDAVNGILAAWRRGKSGERYILAGENITIKSLFEMIAAEAGVEAPRYKLPTFVLHLIGIIGDLITKFGGKFSLSRENAYTATMFHWFDNSKAKKELGFQPRPAKQAIHQSVKWMKENGLLNS